MTNSEPEEKLVIAFHGNSTTEAELVRVLLEEAEIYSVIIDRNNPIPGLDLNPFDPDSGNVGCDVYVRKSDLERAIATIRQSKEKSQGNSEE